MRNVKDHGLSFAVVWIGPDDARAIIDTQENNRNVARFNVKKLAASMERDEFLLNGQTIVLDEDGRLIDGQHRLLAIIESGKEVAVIIVRGVKRANNPSIDHGKPRNLSDVLSMRGVKNAYVVASVVGYVHRVYRGVRISQTGMTAPTIGEGLEILETHPEIETYVTYARSRNSPLLSPSYIGFLLWYLSQRDGNKALEFLDSVLMGYGLKPGDAVYALRDRLTRKRSGMEKLSTEAIFFFVVKTWHAWLKGESISRFRYDPDNDGLLKP